MNTRNSNARLLWLQRRKLAKKTVFEELHEIKNMKTILQLYSRSIQSCQPVVRSAVDGIKQNQYTYVEHSPVHLFYTIYVWS